MGLFKGLLALSVCRSPPRWRCSCSSASRACGVRWPNRSNNLSRGVAMKRSQLIVVLAAVAAIAAIVVAGRGGGGDKPQGAAARASSSGPAGAVRVTMASSPEKLALVQALAKDFNASGAKVGGRPVFVSAYTANSGDEEAAIARAARGPGGDRPVVWSPASTLWARLLDNETDRGLVATKNPSIVRSPLVLAMW